MINIMEIGQWFLTCWVLTQWISEWIYDINPEKILPKKRLLRLIGSTLLYVLSCDKCFSFWFVLIMSQNFYHAAATSLLIMTVSKLTQNIKTKL
jgi:hypothetical protein